LNVKVKEGALLKIKLGQSYFAFGRVLKHSEMAFYNYQAFTDVVDMSDIYSAPIAFIVPVYGSAKKSGRWSFTDIRPLEQSLLKQRLYFMRDDATGQYSLYKNDTGETYPASQDECKNLERAAVWEAEHVESRLQDFFNGKSNKWLQQLNSGMEKAL